MFPGKKWKQKCNIGKVQSYIRTKYTFLYTPQVYTYIHHIDARLKNESNCQYKSNSKFLFLFPYTH